MTERRRPSANSIENPARDRTLTPRHAPLCSFSSSPSCWPAEHPGSVLPFIYPSATDCWTWMNYDAWNYGWRNGWIDRWMDLWMNGWMDGEIDGSSKYRLWWKWECIEDGYTLQRAGICVSRLRQMADGRMDGWLDDWLIDFWLMRGLIDTCMAIYIKSSLVSSSSKWIANRISYLLRVTL